MSERIHFKLAVGGVTHRFASTLAGDDLYDAVRAKVVSVVGDERVEMYWIDDDSHVVLSCSEDLQTAIDFARFTRTNPAKPPCVFLAVRGAAAAAAPQEQQQAAVAAAPATTESGCSRVNCPATFPSQGFIDYDAATWRCALCSQQNVVPRSFYDGPPTVYFAMPSVAEHFAKARQESKIAEEMKAVRSASDAVDAVNDGEEDQKLNDIRPRIRVEDIHAAFLGDMAGQGVPMETPTKLGILHNAVEVIKKLEDQVARRRQESKIAENAEKEAAAVAAKPQPQTLLPALAQIHLPEQQILRGPDATYYNRSDSQAWFTPTIAAHVATAEAVADRLRQELKVAEEAEKEAAAAATDAAEDDDEDVDDEVDEDEETTDEDEEGEEESEEEEESESFEAVAIETTPEQHQTVQHDGGFSRLPYSDEEEELSSEEESEEESEDEEEEELQTAIEDSTSEEEESEEESDSEEEEATFEQVEEQEESIKSDAGSWTLEDHPTSPVAVPAVRAVPEPLPVGLVGADRVPRQLVQYTPYPVEEQAKMDEVLRAILKQSTFNIQKEEVMTQTKERMEQAAARARLEVQQRYAEIAKEHEQAQQQPTALEKLQARECALAEKEAAFERRVASFAVEIEEFEERIRLLENRVGRAEKGKDGEMEKRMDEVEERLNKMEM